jgi:hypothetical protein
MKTILIPGIFSLKTGVVMPLFFIFIWFLVLIGTLVLMLKIREKRQKRKKDPVHKAKLAKALAEKWIRINIKETRFAVEGVTDIHITKGFEIGHSTIDALDKQFFTHPVKTTYFYYCRIGCVFEIDKQPIQSISHVLHMNPKSVEMFCESGLFDILVNPEDHRESVWMEL